MSSAPQSPLSILVTGAGSGVGRGLAIALAAEHRALLLADRNRDALAETASLLKTSTAVSLHPFDVTSAAQISEFVDSLGAARVDVLINNAGVQHVAPVEQFPEDRWDLLLDVMLKGPFLLAKALLPRMREAGFGRLVNIGSIHSLIASPYKSAYVAAKHGLVGLTKTLALETAGTDITVNTICPAYVRTPLVDAQIRDQAKAHGISEEEVIKKIFLEPMPKKAFISFEEIAAAVEFLISPAARNITGQTLTIDGGWTAR
jgi:3-hydroxybutyrate dehydrogenase